MSWNPLKLGGSAGGLMKSAGARLAALRKTDGTQAEGGVIRSSGGGRFSKIAMATGVAKKMNGDTSASNTISAVDRSFKKHKRNNIFGN